MQRLTLRHGDCVEVLKGYEDGSIGAFVCDPPYHISFMGKKWDAEGAGIAFSADLWDEVYRVLRPGGVVKAFSGTRTFHRMAAAMAEAGLTDLRIESWNYGSGFPKSMNISKKMDRRGGVGVDREAFYQHLKSRREAMGLSRTEVTERVTGQRTGSCWNWEHFSLPEPRFWPALRDLLGLDPAWESLIVGAEREVIEERTMTQGGGTALMIRQGERREVEANITAPATTPAQRWEGWGTALKPSWEPVVVGRKPE